MLFNTWSTLTLLALSTSVAASPAPIATRTDVDTPFTFSQWIEGIIADPNGSHLTAEEAIAASHMKRRSDNHVKRHPYVDCMEFIPEESSFSPANVRLVNTLFTVDQDFPILTFQLAGNRSSSLRGNASPHRRRGSHVRCTWRDRLHERQDFLPDGRCANF